MKRTFQKGFLTARQAIVLLVLLFLAPTFVAWVMHNVGDGGWQSGKTTNSGTLVHPARPLELADDFLVGERPLTEYLQGKWTLLYIGDAACDDVCKLNLYKMRQVRIAQNEHMKRVQRLFIIANGKPVGDVAAFLSAEHPRMDTVMPGAGQLEQLGSFFSIDEQPVTGAQRVYLVDPLGNLMMYYPPDADAGGMLKDLKKLLKYSRIG